MNTLYFQMKLQNPISSEQTLSRIKRFCAYQERSHQDVRAKLFELGVHKQQADTLIAQLIEQGYLNEERFAVLFAGGKFRIKHWGRKKIEQALKTKQVSSYCIKKALAQIDEPDYLATLSKLAAARQQQLRGEKNRFVKMKKLQDFLLQKGYEYELVKEQLNRMSPDDPLR